MKLKFCLQFVVERQTELFLEDERSFVTSIMGSVAFLYLYTVTVIERLSAFATPIAIIACCDVRHSIVSHSRCL